MTTPDEHDREAALVQGLTHLIAKVLVQMEPLPTRMTTGSFELLMQGVDMVRHDAPEVLRAMSRRIHMPSWCADGSSISLLGWMQSFRHSRCRTAIRPGKR